MSFSKDNIIDTKKDNIIDTKKEAIQAITLGLYSPIDGYNCISGRVLLYLINKYPRGLSYIRGDKRLVKKWCPYSLSKHPSIMLLLRNLEDFDWNMGDVSSNPNLDMEWVRTRCVGLEYNGSPLCIGRLSNNPNITPRLVEMYMVGIERQTWDLTKLSKQPHFQDDDDAKLLLRRIEQYYINKDNDTWDNVKLKLQRSSVEKGRRVYYRPLTYIAPSRESARDYAISKIGPPSKSARS